VKKQRDTPGRKGTYNGSLEAKGAQTRAAWEAQIGRQRKKIGTRNVAWNGEKGGGESFLGGGGVVQSRDEGAEKKKKSCGEQWAKNSNKTVGEKKRHVKKEAPSCGKKKRISKSGQTQIGNEKKEVQIRRFSTTKNQERGELQTRLRCKWPKSEQACNKTNGPDQTAGAKNKREKGANTRFA